MMTRRIKRTLAIRDDYGRLYEKVRVVRLIPRGECTDFLVALKDQDGLDRIMRVEAGDFQVMR